MEKKIYHNMAAKDFDKLTHSLYYNKNNNKICVVPYYINHIQLIDLEGNDDVVLSTANSDNWSSVQRQEDFMELSVFYGSTRITNDYIFALYSNKKLSYLAANSPKEAEIHVFNWEGDAVANIRLDDDIVSFAVDAKNNILYGINNSEQIYAYDISSCLE